MSTHEEIEQERTQLIALSETMREMTSAVRDYRTEQIAWFETMLARIRKTNSSPEMRELEVLAQERNPDYNPRAVEEQVEAFITQLSARLDHAERTAENTWLGIEESIIALEETGEVPSPTNRPLLPDQPPRPGPDDLI